MFKMSLDQHRRNLRRIQNFINELDALGLKGDKSDVTQVLLEMTLSDIHPSPEQIHQFLIEWGVLNYWDEYQATAMIHDILDYRLD